MLMAFEIHITAQKPNSLHLQTETLLRARFATKFDLTA